ncbi:hypothetical protein EOD42_25405, partial [Rhodovarius crocodyli]
MSAATPRKASARLEIPNSGYSLKARERLGEPGSEPRNPTIAAVLHELNFAETKGTGIRIMQTEMRRADLTSAVTCPPETPPKITRVRPTQGRTNEAITVHGRADHRDPARAGGRRAGGGPVQEARA